MYKYVCIIISRLCIYYYFLKNLNFSSEKIKNSKSLIQQNYITKHNKILYNSLLSSFFSTSIQKLSISRENKISLVQSLLHLLRHKFLINFPRVLPSPRNILYLPSSKQDLEFPCKSEHSIKSKGRYPNVRTFGKCTSRVDLWIARVGSHLSSKSFAWYGRPAF